MILLGIACFAAGAIFGTIMFAVIVSSKVEDRTRNAYGQGWMDAHEEIGKATAAGVRRIR